MSIEDKVLGSGGSIGRRVYPDSNRASGLQVLPVKELLDLYRSNRVDLISEPTQPFADHFVCRVTSQFPDDSSVYEALFIGIDDRDIDQIQFVGIELVKQLIFVSTKDSEFSTNPIASWEEKLPYSQWQGSVYFARISPNQSNWVVLRPHVYANSPRC